MVEKERKIKALSVKNKGSVPKKAETVKLGTGDTTADGFWKSQAEKKQALADIESRTKEIERLMKQVESLRQSRDMGLQRIAEMRSNIEELYKNQVDAIELLNSMISDGYIFVAKDTEKGYEEWYETDVSDTHTLKGLLLQSLGMTRRPIVLTEPSDEQESAERVTDSKQLGITQ